MGTGRRGMWFQALWAGLLALVSFGYVVAGIATRNLGMSLIALVVMSVGAFCSWVIWPTRRKFQPHE